MPISKGRRRGTYRVTVYAHGKQHEWIVEGKRADAEQFEARRRIALDAVNPLTTRSAITFFDLCRNHYRPHAELTLGADTWNKVRKYQVTTLLMHFRRLRLTDFSPEKIEAYKVSRLEEVGASSVNNELRVLGTILKWAREERGLRVADVKIRRLPTRGLRRVHWWSADEAARLLAKAQELEPGLYPLLFFLLNTGCRKGEAIAAEWSWIRAGTLHIPVTEVWQPKHGRAREVPVSDALANVLDGLPRSASWLFPAAHGGRYASFPKEAFWRVRNAAELQGGVHTTRHTFASHFLRSQPDMMLLAQVLGHSHTRITELYSHLLPDHLARARNVVNLT